MPNLISCVRKFSNNCIQSQTHKNEPESLSLRTRMREFKHFQMVAPLVKNQVTPLVGHDDSTLPVGNSWSCQQNNANNAYNVVVPSGSVNFSGKSNSFALVPVAAL